MLALLLAACAGDEATTTTIGAIDDPTATTVPAPTSRPATTTSAAPKTTTTSPPTTTTSPPTTTLATVPETWIAVLASLPTSEYTAAEAEARTAVIAEQIGTEALEVKLLLSDDYTSLEPGFWVVYLGQFRDESQAVAACDSVGAPDCYARALATLADDEALGVDEGYVLAILADGPLAVVEIGSGEIPRIIDDYFYADGVYPGSPTLAADGRRVFYSVGSEDWWFSCEAADGTLVEMDLTTGEAEQVADGFSPAISPDGSTLLYLAASQCVEDPNEANFVLAPIDTIVHRNLGNGDESRTTLPLDGDIAAGYEYRSAVWGPDGSTLILDTNGALLRVDISGDATLVTELDDAHWWLAGYLETAQSVMLVAQVFENDTAMTLVGAVHPATGEMTTVAEYPGLGAVAVDRTGAHLIIAAEEELIIDGASVPLGLQVVDLAG